MASNLFKILELEHHLSIKLDKCCVEALKSLDFYKRLLPWSEVISGGVQVSEGELVHLEAWL